MTKRVSDQDAHDVYMNGEACKPENLTWVDYAGDLLNARARIEELEKALRRLRSKAMHATERVPSCEPIAALWLEIDEAERVLGEGE